MDVADYFDFNGPNDIRIRGHRLGIESILYEHVHNHLRPEEIQERFPTLRLDQIYASILYYLRHRPEMDRYLDQWLEFGRQGRQEQARESSATMDRLRKLKAQRSTPSQA